MRDHPRSIMIFAAGRGTRMAPLTDATPKPLIEVSGRALIDHALDLAGDIPTVVVNAHYLADMLEDHLKGHDVTLLREEDLLETGGGLLNALPVLGEGPVLTLNSDAVWRGENVLSQLLKTWDPSRMEALVSVVPIDRALGHDGTGDFVLDNQGRVRRGAGMVYTGAQIITTERLKTIQDKAFSMNVVWDQMIPASTLYGLTYTGHWCDVGRPESISIAEDMLDV